MTLAEIANWVLGRRAPKRPPSPTTVAPRRPSNVSPIERRPTPRANAAILEQIEYLRDTRGDAWLVARLVELARRR